MEIYIIWAVCGIVFLFLELILPALFFLNLSAAAFFAAIYSFYFPREYTIQVIIFMIISALCLLFLRPLMIKRQNKNHQTGVEGKYIGQEAQVINTIGTPGTDGIGKIKIYGEVWQASSKDGQEIEPGAMVRIVANESIVMIVERIN